MTLAKSNINNELENDIYIKALLERKAYDIVILNISKISSICDKFIICSGKSSTQVRAVAEFVERFLRKNGIKALDKEGIQEGNWALLDYGDVIIHVFYEPTRKIYDIEGLWLDAERIDLQQGHYKRQPGSGGGDGADAFFAQARADDQVGQQAEDRQVDDPGDQVEE